MKKTFVLFITLFFATIFLFGCGQSNLPAKNEPSSLGKVEIVIAWPSVKGLKTMAIPESSVTIEVTVSAADFDAFQTIITYPQTVGTIEVKTGSNRKISANARNSSGQIVATGEVSGLAIVAGTNEPVSLTLTDVRGGCSFFPNTDGYSWHYKYSDGTELIQTFEGTSTINGSLVVQNLRSTYLNSSGNVTSTSESCYVINDAGVYYYGTPSSPTTEGQPQLIFPLEIGETWTYSLDTIKVIATVKGKESVTVPAGSFDCYKVEYDFYSGAVKLLSVFEWFGDNIGVVKVLSSDLSFESVLQSKNF